MKQETISRGQFLKELGLSSTALMAFYCMGTTLTACSSGSDSPTPATPTTPTTPGTGTAATGLTGNTDLARGKIDFALDLTAANYSRLRTLGEYAWVGDVMVAFVRGNTYIALAKACTHQGSSVQYRLANDDVWCANHGSVFSTDGMRQSGPATGRLTMFATALSTNGNTLTIKE